MSRDLTPGLQSRITDRVTSRRWLLHLAYDPPFRVYSGHGVKSWGGETWQGYPFEVHNIVFGVSGDARADIVFSNADTTLTGLLLGPQGVAGISASLYYFDSDEAVVFIQGKLDVASIANTVAVKLSTDDSATDSAPRLVAGPPIANWITPAGTTISWGNERLTIERREA